MTQKNKLKEIIEYAVNKGFVYRDVIIKDWWSICDYDDEGIIIEWGDSYAMSQVDYSTIIFSHEFVKAYFGNKTIEVCIINQLQKDLDSYVNTMPMLCWEYHIKQLALTPEKERINYLYKFIEGDK